MPSARTSWYRFGGLSKLVGSHRFEKSQVNPPSQYIRPMIAEFSPRTLLQVGLLVSGAEKIIRQHLAKAPHVNAHEELQILPRAARDDIQILAHHAPQLFRVSQAPPRKAERDLLRDGTRDNLRTRVAELEDTEIIKR